MRRSQHSNTTQCLYSTTASTRADLPILTDSHYTLGLHGDLKKNELFTEDTEEDVNLERPFCCSTWVPPPPNPSWLCSIFPVVVNVSDPNIILLRSSNKQTACSSPLVLHRRSRAGEDPFISTEKEAANLVKSPGRSLSLATRFSSPMRILRRPRPDGIFSPSSEYWVHPGVSFLPCETSNGRRPGGIVTRCLNHLRPT
ncbi:unnamed protein product [Pleuronectes platessa]|uniref:Uncharacterized protein n=1 Tax=Pleuronectes platessa TaxID=8262 RepID=A0A9N7U2Y1_PLEPL|nr:unnamed protein product [Pleuronectes platessa]